MKKIIFVFGLFLLPLLGEVFAEALNTDPLLKVSLSPATQPTQKIDPGTKEVELLSILLFPKDTPNNGPILSAITFQRNGEPDNINHFTRFKLVYDEVVLARISLPDQNTIVFDDLDIWLPDEETAELRLIGDIAFGDIKSSHVFSLVSKDSILLHSVDGERLETNIIGSFPVESNKVLIGHPEEKITSSDCNLREEPVCGEDGKSYYNYCIPYQKGIRIVDDRACPTLPPVPDYCSRIYNPVCGEDGITYHNICVLEESDVSQDYEGECFPETFEIYSLIEAVKLFEHKKIQLSQIRPRISNDAEAELGYISALLVSYDFTQSVRQDLISKITNFLNFTKNPSDRSVLEGEIHNLLLAVVMAESTSNQKKYETGKIPFVDVGTEKWYFGAVDFLKKSGWAEGYKDKEGQETGEYRPENYVTKSEITKLILMAKGLNVHAIDQGHYAPKNPLARYNHWATNLIGYAEEQGYTIWADYPNPDKKATRGEVIRLAFEGFQIKPPQVLNKSSFSDVSPNSNNFPYIEYAKQLGIIRGYADGTFKEDEAIIRAEAAKIVKNAYEIFWGE